LQIAAWAISGLKSRGDVVALPMQNLAAMNEKAAALKKRTKEFALAVLGFVTTLPNSDDAKIIARQLIRSATGVGANYRATCRSRSKAEFVARIGVALEEADESAFWLEIITEGRMATTEQAFKLLDEADQLSAILAASSLTASESLQRSAAVNRRSNLQ
jgi:four helix bundle protein